MGSDASATATVRESMDAYLAQDLSRMAELLAPEYVFTSPQDDHIDRDAFLHRCFPTAARLVSQRIVQLVDAGDNQVFLMYEYELRSGGRFRNVEFTTVVDGRLVETQVFFGGQVDT